MESPNPHIAAIRSVKPFLQKLSASRAVHLKWDRNNGPLLS
jgi:hypothetical protein